MEKQIILGESALLTQALEQLSLIAPLNKPLLIVGERGTGKELIAERLHFLSERWQKPFLKINCAALTESLLESTLFGHEVGAFTGATKRQKGYFERAHEGTLFLDELGTVSIRVQEKLLRVIEYGEFERLGGQQSIVTDTRIVAATNADLVEQAQQKKFRADLLDRLAFDVINLPPLRYRPEDIPILAEHFAILMSRELGREIFMGFTRQASETLIEHPWFGNIRELKNVVQRSVYRHQDVDSAISDIILNPFTTPWPASVDDSVTIATQKTAAPKENEEEFRPGNLKQQVSAFEIRQIQSSLHANHYHQKHTAKALGLSYHQLRAYFKKYPQLLRK